MTQNKSDDDSGRGYDHSIWLKIVTRLGGGTTAQIHEEVATELAADPPSRRTTSNKLEKLYEWGEIEREEVGGSFKWLPLGQELEQSIVQLLRRNDVMTVDRMMDEIEVSRNRLQDALYDLQDEGIVDSDQIAEQKEVWFIDE